jgi:hypothetical protein
MQTTSLRLQGRDQRQYVFRSVDKDPGAEILPPFLRKTFVDELLQDQTSASLPTGALVVAPLLEAVGVLHADPQLVQMPDESALGEYRKTFAGVLGLIEERPRDGPGGAPGFAGSRKIEGTEYVWNRIEDSPKHQVDARAFLTARLIDVLVGDWDRHYDQWRWARYPTGDGYRWQPIPRDRDQAFARFDGVVHWFARSHMPQFVNFGESYGSIYGLTWSARALDRRFLSGLERSEWDSVTQNIRLRLTDEVIDQAVSRIRTEASRAMLSSLSRVLKQRRDRLAQAADRFYELLAAQVDIHATDEADVVEVVRRDDSRIEAKVFSASATGRIAGNRSLRFRRTFRRGETREIRLYLHGGNDTAVVRGAVQRSIHVRVVGGGGDDLLVDSSSVGRFTATSFYDARGTNRFETRRTEVDRRPFREPPRTDVLLGGTLRSVSGSIPELPPRDLEDPFKDWGTLLLPIPWLAYQPDVGIVLGMGVQRFAYGFRKVPHASRMELRAGFASGPDRFYVQYLGDSPDFVQGVDAALEVQYSGVDIVRFYGFGNETELVGPDEYYRITQRKFSIDPSVTYNPSPKARFAVGPFLTFTGTKMGQGNFIDSIRPYGSGRFTEMGIQGSFVLDTRDRSVAATRGFHFDGGARLVPSLLEVTSTFGSVYGEASTYLTADVLTEPTLALRVGGKKVWGEAPFHESAFLGGATTLRGYSEERFAGDATAYGNAELRLFLVRFSVGDFGIFGLGDVGRVFLNDESSGRWHAAAGGGIWFALASRAATVSLSLASGERRSFYAMLGFMF